MQDFQLYLLSTMRAPGLVDQALGKQVGGDGEVGVAVELHDKALQRLRAGVVLQEEVDLPAVVVPAAVGVGAGQAAPLWGAEAMLAQSATTATSGTYEMTPEQRVDQEADVRSLCDGMSGSW